MAITFVGSASAVGGATATTITLPTVLQDDFVITFTTKSGATGGVPSTGGYTLILNNGTNAVLTVYAKQMSASPDTSVTISGHSGAATLPISHLVMAFRGVAPGFLDTASIFTTGLGANPNPPAITPVTNNTCILVAAGNRANDATPGDITNYTTTSINGTAASGTAATTTAAAYRILSGGGGVSEDPGAWGTWAAGVPLSNWTAITMALLAASDATVHTVDQATITLTGQTVSQADVIPVEAGTLAFAGDEVGLLGGDRITIDNSDATFSGQTVTVLNQEFEIIPKYVVRSGEPNYRSGRGSGITLRG